MVVFKFMVKLKAYTWSMLHFQGMELRNPRLYLILKLHGKI